MIPDSGTGQPGKDTSNLLFLKDNKDTSNLLFLKDNIDEL